MELRDREDFQALLVQMKEHPLLKPFCDKPKEFWELENYTKALVKDDNTEKAKRRTAPPTRSCTKGKALSDSENKLLVVYPFPIEQEKLHSLSSMINELGGNGLGLDIDVIMEDAAGDVCNDETDARDRAEIGTSARTHYLSIREDDKERLEPGQFLNDTLVDFWMSWISRDHSRNAGPNQVHFFTSHFLTTLQEDRPEGVTSWTINEKRNRKIPIFEKKFIFVPVNGDLHWSLCVIVNPGLIMKAHAVGEMDDVNSREDETADEWPCILFLDSLRMHKRYRLAKTLRQWLNFEWNRTMNDTDGFIDDPFDDRMAIVSPNVPRQDNGCDCGVFVCRYAYSLYLMRDMVFSFSGVQNHFKRLITYSPAFDFGMEDIARIREEMKVLIDALSPLYYQHKKEEKAMKAAAKREKEESSKAAQEDGAAENVHEKENSPLAVRHAQDEEVAL